MRKVRIAVDVVGGDEEPKVVLDGIDAALAAARKARFTESRAAVQGGTITYIFRME